MSEPLLPIRPLQRAKHDGEVYERLRLVSWSTILTFYDVDCIKATNKYYFNLKMHFCTQEPETPRLYFTSNLTNKKVQLHENNRRSWLQPPTVCTPGMNTTQRPQ